MSETVLVVDDKASMVAILKAILQKFDYHVISATSEQAALDMIRQSVTPGGQQIDLVLLDIMMPEIGGIELCRSIRADKAFADLPIMMVTALASIDDRLAAFDAGADDYLIKPIEHRELLARMRVQFRLRRAERDVQRRSRELTALRSVSETLSHSAGDLEAMLKRALAVTCDVLRTDVGAIYLMEDNGDYMQLAVARGLSKKFLTRPTIRRLEIRGSNISELVKAGKSLTVEDLYNSPSSNQEHMQRENIRSGAYVPIRAEGSVIGVLINATNVTRTFHAEEIELLETIGAQLGVAIMRTQLHEEASAARDQARELARQVVQAQEDERRRIAQELHDQLGQTITALKLDLILLRDELPAKAKKLRPRLTEDIIMASDLLEGIQTLSLSLRPAILDDLGLLPALRWYSDLFSQRTGLKINLALDAFTNEDERLPAEVEIVVFRCLQEILTNAARHAQAKHISIRLDNSNGEFRMSVQDDGIGFRMEEVLGQNAAYQSMGLTGMQERAALIGGSVRIDSQPDKGTLTTLTIPLQAQLRNPPTIK